MPNDISTAILIDGDGVTAFKNSESVLRLLLLLSFPWSIMGMIGLWFPRAIRDAGYRTFARNRGDIWKAVKRVSGMGDTILVDYKHRIVGVEENSPVPESWGLAEGKKRS